MNQLPESTINLFLSGLMGALGSIISIPINLMLSSQLRREEQKYQHKLDVIAKQRELILQHKLQLESKGKDNEIEQIKTALIKLNRLIEEAKK